MNSALIVALPIGDRTVTYKDGDTAPLHQTLVFFGDTLNVTPEERAKISNVVSLFATHTYPFTAKVIGKGTLGPDQDEVVFTESRELTRIRERFVGDFWVNQVMTRTEQHPNWISHVSGMQNAVFGDFVLFNRLAFWFGDEREVFEMRSPSHVMSEKE
jgi:hypothetical protein